MNCQGKERQGEHDAPSTYSNPGARGRAAAVMAAIPLALSAVPASAAPHQARPAPRPALASPWAPTSSGPAGAAEPPAGLPKQPGGYQAPTALASGAGPAGYRRRPQGRRPDAAASASAPATATAAAWSRRRRRGPGAGSGSGTALVVYDTTGTWGWLGETVRHGGGQPGQPLRQGDRRTGRQLRRRPGEQLHGHDLPGLDLQRADPGRLPQRRAVHHAPGDLGRQTTSGS